MLIAATSTLRNVALGIHIIAVIAILLVVLGYPLVVRFADAVRKRPPVHVHRLRVALSRFVVNPALVLALIAGIYLAGKEHQWHRFYVQFGIAALVVIGGLEGALIARGHRRLAQLAQEEHDGDGHALERYRKRERLNDLAEWTVVIIVVLTAIFMFAKP